MAKADLERAHLLHPSIAMGEPEWMDFFDGREGRRAMGRILYDIYDQIKEDEEREAGRRRVGRRPGREPVPLDEVFKTIFLAPPSLEVFHVALRELMGTMSMRALAKRIGMSSGNFSYYTNGKLKPDLYLMEKIALVLKVHPSYFIEWRAQYVAEMIRRVYMTDPKLSITAYKAIRLGNKRVLARER